MQVFAAISRDARVEECSISALTGSTPRGFHIDRRHDNQRDRGSLLS
jgi:hypothetical protein